MSIRLAVAWTCVGSALVSAPPRAVASGPHASAAPAVASSPAVFEFDDFTQVAPRPGAAPSRRTTVILQRVGDALEVRVRAFDPAPAGIVARQMRRDADSILSDDHVALVVDPDGAGRNGYMFAVNALGAQWDALVYDGSRLREDWDALWHSEAGVDASGWWATLRVPLSVLGGWRDAAASAGGWRVNAERWIAASSERVRLAGWRPDQDVYSLGEGRRLPAFQAAAAGWGLHLKPSLRLAWESAAAAGRGRATTRLEPGLELFHESRAGVRSAAAINLDFGDAEADERVVNLERFELLRDEQREFFLRDAGVFAFGGLGESAVVPYYSRRIGLDAQGRARSLDLGLRVSGAAAGFDIGVLGARVAGGPVAPDLPAQRHADVAVLRLARPLGSAHRIGAIATSGNPQGVAGSRLWGVDYQFHTTRWAGDRTLSANAWLQSSSNPGAGSGRAWGANLDLPNVGLNGYADWMRIDEAFDPALGYLAEAGVTRSEGQLGWWFLDEAGHSWLPALDWAWRERLDDSERTLMLNPEISWFNAAGDTLMAEYFTESDRLAGGFEPVPGLQIAPGRYRFHYLYGFAETSTGRPWSASAEWRRGDYYGGRRHDLALDVTWKPGPHWGFTAGGSRVVLRLPSGRATVRTASFRLDHTPSPALVQTLLLQWDDVSRELGASARLRWTWSPGQDLIVAVDRLASTAGRQDRPPERSRVLVKMVWSFER